MRHITEPHLSTPEDAQAYESLLAALRKDLQLDAQTDVLAGTVLQAIMPGTSLQYLLDTAGNAPFLQLLSAGKRKIAFGVSALTWAGASRNSNTLTITHGLGVSPASIQATASVQSDGSFCFVVLTTSGSTTFSVIGSNPYEVPVNGTTAPLNWMALG